MAGRIWAPAGCGRELAFLAGILLSQGCALDPVSSGPDKITSTVTVRYEGRDIEVVEGKEIRILFREDADESVRQKIIMQYGFYVERRMLYGYFIYYMNILNPNRVEGVVQMLRVHPEVEKAEPNTAGGASPFDL